MIGLEERLPPVVFDDAARARLAAALDREGVLVAYPFASQATGKAGPLSDVDVASCSTARLTSSGCAYSAGGRDPRAAAVRHVAGL